MECGQSWPAHTANCVLRYDPADQRLAACASAVVTSPIADVEEGEVFHPTGTVVSRVAAVPSRNRLSLLPDDRVIAEVFPTLLARYIDRFPAVWDMPARRWISCASERQQALICRATQEVELLLEHDDSWWTYGRREALRVAYERLRDIVSGVAADLTETMASAVSA